MFLAPCVGGKVALRVYAQEHFRRALDEADDLLFHGHAEGHEGAVNDDLQSLWGVLIVEPGLGQRSAGFLWHEFVGALIERRLQVLETRGVIGDPAPIKPAIEVLVIRPKRGWTMKRRFSDEQIIGMIKEYEAGVKAQELCRKYGISDATFYKYKAKFGGMNVSDAKKLRALEDENNRLKRMLADAMLDNAALKDLATKNY